MNTVEIDFELDGAPVRARAGETIWQAAARHGVDIPHLCLKDGYRPDGNFSTYLFAIAANLARNHARWKSRHPTISLDEEDDGILSLREDVDSGLAPEEAAASAERLRTIHTAFQALPPDLREAMTLFIHEGMGYAEISAVTGGSAKAVETRIYRARQILKEKLKDIRT